MLANECLVLIILLQLYAAASCCAGLLMPASQRFVALQQQICWMQEVHIIWLQAPTRY